MPQSAATRMRWLMFCGATWWLSITPTLSQQVCCGPPKVCNNSIAGAVKTEELYFVHPAPNATTGRFTWGNHNVATALGDAAFLCVDGTFVKSYNDTLISSFVLEWNTTCERDLTFLRFAWHSVLDLSCSMPR